MTLWDTHVVFGNCAERTVTLENINSSQLRVEEMMMEIVDRWKFITKFLRMASKIC